MATNSYSANSNDDIDRFSTGLENAIGKVGNLTVKDVLGISMYEQVTKKTVDESIILKDLIKNVDNTILKSLAMDTISVLSNWFNDPETICCLIQGIWAMYASTYSNTELAKLQKEGASLADSNFAGWLDSIISFIDLIIVLLTTDMKKISFIIPDFIKEITNTVISAILLVLQETLFAVRDSLIRRILNEIDDLSQENNIWSKCLPFQQLINVIKRYVNDYGLFATLFEKIKGFVSNKVGEFGKLKDFNLPKNVKDLEFLYWCRDLLIKLKQATLNFDLCVKYSNSPNGGLADKDDTPTPNILGTFNSSTGSITRPNPSEVQGIKITANGTILEDKASLANNSLPILANSSTRLFLNKYYGLPLDVVDNYITTTTSNDHIQGTNINSTNLSDINADCPNSPRPQEIVQWALRVRNRNLQ